MGQTRALMKWPLFLQLFGFLWIVAFALFSLNQPSESSSTKFVSVMNACWQFTLWYNFCQLSENVTHLSEKIMDCLYNLDWVSMPVPRRKALLFMMARSQDEFRFTCLGVVNCSLTIFSEVNFRMCCFQELSK